MWWWIDDSNNDYWGSFQRGNPYFNLVFHDAYGIYFSDSLHPSMNQMGYWARYNPNATDSSKRGHFFCLNSDIQVAGNRADSINYSIYVQGYEVRTTASDRRLKKRIRPSEDNALELINKIKIQQFDWRKPRTQKRKHVNYGYIAQETQKVLVSLVDYNKEYDTYQMDLLNLSALHTKGLQEVDNKIKLIFEFLLNQQNLKEKWEEFINGKGNKSCNK